MSRGWFVTGTDTGVGKTLASCALLHALRAAHPRCIGMKPVAAGTDTQGHNEDVLALRAASNVAVPATLDNPVLLAEPLSPHIAAARAGRSIEIKAIVRAYGELASQADAVVVEGAGGFLVPLSPNETGADLAAALGLPVILVVGLRLGCLNHALLTRDAIQARGLRLAGWIANRIDPTMAEQEANLAYLREQLGAPLLADWPWQPGAETRGLRLLQLPD
ncbi:dethiobiotin synthase [Methylibium sp.]|uniref:dethiobiotin synthase n=1 Tax=Methylibium sp. TaxID=2067992 RepID=UPI0025E75E34|nr:dethiobiotin synthase [Methylibium sp.]